MNSPSRLFVAGRKILLVVLLVALVGGAGWGIWRWQHGDEGEVNYRIEPVVRGRVAHLINASGTIVPEEVVDVGAQVAGQIIEFGDDLDRSGRKIDYGSRVDEGTLLARIDPKLYAPEVGIAKAELAVAEAEVERCKANIIAADAKLTQAKNDLDRVRSVKSNIVSPVERDALTSAYTTAKASVPAAKAELVKAQKQVERAKELLKKAETNLKYTEIRSPVKGVIVDRRVNIGQTVVSSLNAPSLFLLAKDLKKVSVWASVNEADVGNIHPGQSVNFKVDAYPKDVFTGVVSQIRLNATMTQNVVTYTVVITTDNSDLRLLPYMTANLQFRVAERTNVLLVPNAALRYRPAPERVAAAYLDEYQNRRRRKPTVTEMKAGKKVGDTFGTLWVAEGALLRPVRVKTGLTDGAVTEIIEALDGDISEGTELVTGEVQQKQQGGTNPFAPKMWGKKK